MRSSLPWARASTVGSLNSPDTPNAGTPNARKYRESVAPAERALNGLSVLAASTTLSAWAVLAVAFADG